MTTITIVDDSEMLVELLALRLGEIGYEVNSFANPEKVIETIRAAVRNQATAPSDIILLDLSFPQSELTGIDVLMANHEAVNRTKVVLYTQGDRWAADQLRLAWELFRPASCVSKLSHVGYLEEVLREVARTGEAEVDPNLAVYLPATRSVWRTLEGYERLVPHAGHAKLWSALMASDVPPTYQQISECTGLAINTLRNYRDDVIADLRLFGCQNPTLRAMHEFAIVNRALLVPMVTAKLAGSDRYGAPRIDC